MLAVRGNGGMQVMFNAFKRLRGFLLRREQPIVRRIKRRPLSFEAVEHRRVLSVNAPDAIIGVVFADANTNDTFDVGEGIEGASVALFLDDGDGVF